MDLQFWIWLIVIVITLIARSNKKKSQPINPNKSQLPSEQENKPISFEDLLREIQEAKNPKKKAISPAPKKVIASTPVKEYDYEDYDDNLEDEAKSLEEEATVFQDDKIYETYENAKKQAFLRPSLEESLKVEDTKVQFAQFKEYDKKEGETLSEQYIKELQNPGSFKKAFILSEILNRKF
jgi:hypothetical protein